MEEDTLSNLPDPLLSHILSFLPTKQAVATSVLSKKWTPLWCSVPTLDFTDAENYTRSKEDYDRFVHSVNAAIHSLDLHQQQQPIQNFRIRFNAHDNDHSQINVWVNAAVQRRVQHLDVSVVYTRYLKQCTILSAMFTCRTLVVLKLEGLELNPIFDVDLPVLKVLHLQDLTFSDCGCLDKILSGCSVVEDFKANRLVFNNYLTGWQFRTLPKLVRADISILTTCFLLMGVVNNVEFLRISEVEYIHLHDWEGTDPYVFHKFHNLICMELVYDCYNNDWFQVVELLSHFPKLQVLVINQTHVHDFEFDGFEEEGVPECALLHLKRFYLSEYRGTEGEFQLARYIMQNGRSLERITICCGTAVNEQEKLKMLEKLSSCTRSSATCKLSFK